MMGRGNTTSTERIRKLTNNMLRTTKLTDSEQNGEYPSIASARDVICATSAHNDVILTDKLF